MNKTILMVLDGVGYSPNTASEGNAVAAASMPCFKGLLEKYQNVLIKASGEEVGLPKGENGNSEVGHITIGSGQTILQGVSVVDQAFESGKVFKSKGFEEVVKNVLADSTRALHLIGLLSDGNVHSNEEHLYKILNRLAASGVKEVYVHALLDGRDVPPRSAKNYIQKLQERLNECNKAYGFNYSIASVGGRGNIAMDRYEANTELIQKAFDVYVNGDAPYSADILTQLDGFYASPNSTTDQDFPVYITNKNGVIKQNDSVVLFNFRGDRAVELCEMFDSFKYVQQARQKLSDVCFAGMLCYDAERGIPGRYLIEPPSVKNTLTEWLIKEKVRQYSLAETHKFGHMTYFFNGNRKDKFNDKLETYKEIKSLPQWTCAEQPEMKCFEVTDACIAAIKSEKFDFIKLNFANGDMVGHTGEFDAVVKSLEVLDGCIQKIYTAAMEGGYSLLITADHGNSEEMKYENGQPKTSHTNSLVWFLIAGKTKLKIKAAKEGAFGLSNIAATVCAALDLPANPVWNESIAE